MKLTTWFNCRREKPMRSGWFEFRHTDSNYIHRYFYDLKDDIWFRWPNDARQMGSPSIRLPHCVWRGIAK
jgi:hypothetical protein